MTLKLNGTNSVAAPAYAGDDADTGLQCGTNELKLVTGGTARATVDSNGNVGAGTTSPSFSTFGSNTGGIHIKDVGSSNSGIKIEQGSNHLHLVTSGSRNFIHSGSNIPLAFSTNGSERMRILSSGGITFNGDTAAANALDDYEEGTWTPTINITTTPITGITYTRQAGYYTKIGNVCHVSMWLTWSARTNTSGSTASISLPFTSKNSGNYRGAMHVSTENCTYNGYGFDSGSTRNIGAMAGTHLNTNVAYMEISFTGKNGGGWGSGGISVNGLGSGGGNMQLAGTYLVQ